jgi:C1A family cysteine protease
MRKRLCLLSLISFALLLSTSSLGQLPAMAQLQSQETQPVCGEAPPESTEADSAVEGPAPPTVPPDTAPVQVSSDPPPAGQPQGWIAGETSVSSLSADERAGLCGVPLEVMEWERLQADQQDAKVSTNYTYPRALDWRNLGGRDWTTPIRNQGGCGSCVAFGTTAAVESRLEIARSDPDLNPDLSEADLFYCGCVNCCGTGWSPSSAMNFSRDTGIVAEACYPYTARNQACNLCTNWQENVTRIPGWFGLTSAADMKQALSDHGPFEATMLVYDDFYQYSGGVYRHTWGDLEGGHAVAIVGYNDDEGYWIAKNSWGTSWGEAGWFKIAYGECGIDDYAYVPSPPEPSYRLNASASPEQAGTITVSPSACALSICESGTTVQLTAAPSDGFEFVGWSGDVSGDSNPITVVVDADKEVTAHFTFSCDGCQPRAYLPIVMRP